MNKIPNRQVICETLMEKAKEDRNVVVLCSDSRGSASMTPFFDTFPEQAVETGIAEQDLVSIAAGLAKVGKKPYACSPAAFLSTRSYEQAKVDVAYSNMNVKLIGISGGVSYGALGMSHHSAQDFAAMAAIPNMRVYCPSDRHETRCLFEALYQDNKPAYIRVGRNPVEDVYEAGKVPFSMDQAVVAREGGGDGKKVVIVAAGETVKGAVDAADLLTEQGVSVTVLDMYCIKPFDTETLVRYAKDADLIVSAEEHAPFGGLGAMTALALSENCPKRLIVLSLPDAPAVTGNSKEIFAYYGLDRDGIVKAVREGLKEMQPGCCC